MTDDFTTVDPPVKSNWFKKGDPNLPRGGRPKGSLNKATRTKAMAETMEALAGQNTWMTPMQFLAWVMNNPNQPIPTRVRCAESLAPYVHRKMPIGIDMQDKGPVQHVAIDQLAELPIEQLLLLEAATRLLTPITTAVNPQTAMPEPPPVAQEQEDGNEG